MEQVKVYRVFVARSENVSKNVKPREPSTQAAAPSNRATTRQN